MLKQSQKQKQKQMQKQKQRQKQKEKQQQQFSKNQNLAVPSGTKNRRLLPRSKKQGFPSKKKNSGCSPKTSAECHAHTAFSPDRKAGCQERSSGRIRKHIAFFTRRYERGCEYLKAAAVKLDGSSVLDKGEGDNKAARIPASLQE
jgi:hypothetical protein